ncbi:YSIRK-type signal peptide-containing protein [Streptococcus thermophilus]
MKREKFLHEQQRFSIRKYSFGAASVLLGDSLVFASQALADEHHEVATTSDTILRATSDSDAMTATDVFSGVATDGVASSKIKQAKSQQLAKPLVKLLLARLQVK